MSVNFKALQENLTKVLEDIKNNKAEFSEQFNTAREFKHKIYKEIQKEYLKSEEYKELMSDINSDFDQICEIDYLNYERTIENID